jgi:hypothetical protein
MAALAAPSQAWQAHRPSAAPAPPGRSDSVTKAETAKLQDYLRRKFANNNIRLTAMKTGDSAEVFIGEESIGVIADDKEDGDDSFVFRMAILDIDLEEEA